MSGPSNRRGFLRGLTTLPLVGGSVALIGAPSAVAEPVTPGMIATYMAWLHYEQRAIQSSVGMREGTFIPCVNPGSSYHFPRDFDMDRFGLEAQLRAPLVLSTVGCPLTSVEAEDMWAQSFPPMASEVGL